MFPLIVAVVGACRGTIPAATLSDASPGTTFTSSGDYRIAPLDELKVRVIGDETFDGTYVVSESGAITLPVAGSVAVVERTASEAQGIVQASIAPFVRRPNVTLTVAARRSYRAYFDGEFTRVGAISLDARATLLEAITMAGGLTPFASGRIVLLRADGKGEVRRYATEYQKLRDGEGEIDRVYVERGDVVVAE